jgi:hypothetical protein
MRFVFDLWSTPRHRSGPSSTESALRYQSLPGHEEQVGDYQILLRYGALGTRRRALHHGRSLIAGGAMTLAPATKSATGAQPSATDLLTPPNRADRCIAKAIALQRSAARGELELRTGSSTRTRSFRRPDDSGCDLCTHARGTVRSVRRMAGRVRL